VTLSKSFCQTTGPGLYHQNHTTTTKDDKKLNISLVYCQHAYMANSQCGKECHKETGNLKYPDNVILITPIYCV